MAEKLHLPDHYAAAIDHFLDDAAAQRVPNGLPFVTLTYAASLDSMLSVRPGVQTALSGNESKAMTHYLRARHDAILVGSGTALADDPGLNSRISLQSPVKQPLPVVLDRRGRWRVTAQSKVVKLAAAGQGRGPVVVTSAANEHLVETRALLETCGGGVEVVEPRADMQQVLIALGRRGVTRLMIEGGATIINDLLAHHRPLVGAVVVTVAPLYLGAGGAAVCPERDESCPSLPVARLAHAQWLPMGADAVLLGRMPSETPSV